MQSVGPVSSVPWTSSWMSPSGFWVTVFSAPWPLYLVNTRICRSQGKYFGFVACPIYLMSWTALKLSTPYQLVVPLSLGSPGLPVRDCESLYPPENTTPWMILVAHCLYCSWAMLCLVGRAGQYSSSSFPRNGVARSSQTMPGLHVDRANLTEPGPVSFNSSHCPCCQGKGYHTVRSLQLWQIPTWNSHLSFIIGKYIPLPCHFDLWY